MSIPIIRLFKRRGAKISLALFAVIFLLAYAFPDSAPSRVSQYLNGPSVPKRKPALLYDSNGLAYNWTVGERAHPIEELMEKGRNKWQRLLKR